MGDVIQSQPEALVTDRRSFLIDTIGRGAAWLATSRLATGGALAGALELVVGCGDDDNDEAGALSGASDQERSDSVVTENTLKKTDDLETGESQTVGGEFVTNGEVHCDYHRGMDFGVTVDHSATDEGPETIPITMIDNDFVDEDGALLSEVRVGHGQDVEFTFTNSGSQIHNAMLSQPGVAGPHGDH